MRVLPLFVNMLAASLLIGLSASYVQAQPYSQRAFKGIQKARKRHPSKNPHFKKQRQPLPSFKQKEELKNWQKEVEKNFSAAAAYAQLRQLTPDPLAKAILNQFDELVPLAKTTFPAEFLARNTKMAAFFRKHFLTRVRYIQNNRESILQHITQTVSANPPDYLALLEDKNVIFAAVHHYDPFLAPASHEIVSLVKQYKAKNPKAQVLIAAEALSTTLNGKPVPLLTEENLSLEWLKASHWGPSFNPYTPLAQENGISFLPLENYAQLLKYGKENQTLYAKSPIGLEERNRQWAKHIAEERKRKMLETGEDYDLILVIAGEAHLRYMFPQNLPGIMKEKRSAVIDFSTRNANLFSNFFWDKLPGRAELRIIGPQYYIIKQTDPKTAQLLGADLYINTPL